jgi:hypothetical protein
MYFIFCFGCLGSRYCGMLEWSLLDFEQTENVCVCVYIYIYIYL